MLPKGLFLPVRPLIYFLILLLLVFVCYVWPRNRRNRNFRPQNHHPFAILRIISTFCPTTVVFFLRRIWIHLVFHNWPVSPFKDTGSSSFPLFSCQEGCQAYTLSIVFVGISSMAPVIPSSNTHQYSYPKTRLLPSLFLFFPAIFSASFK